jgi:hypothetical protein
MSKANPGFPNARTEIERMYNWRSSNLGRMKSTYDCISKESARNSKKPPSLIITIVKPLKSPDFHSLLLKF